MNVTERPQIELKAVMNADMPQRMWTPIRYCWFKKSFTGSFTHTLALKCTQRKTKQAGANSMQSAINFSKSNKSSCSVQKCSICHLL